MKNFKNFIVISLMLVAMVFAFTACSDRPAAMAAISDEDDVVVIDDPNATWSDDYENYGSDEYDNNGWDDMFGIDEAPIFGSVIGEVVSIEDANEYGDLRIQIDGEDGSTVFMTYFNTFTLGAAPEVGTTITGYFVMEPFMMAIYPPQHNVTVIVNNDDFQDDGIPFVYVCRFFEHSEGQLISADGELVVNIGDDTDITLQSGEAFDGELAGRMLVVTYAITTRSMPPQAIPIQIIVLYERAVTGPEFVELPDDWVYEDVDDWYCIVIDGEGLVGPHALFMDQDVDFQTHVELIPVAEYLGAEVEWNLETGEVNLEGLNGNISFIVGSNDFTVNGETVTLHHASEDFYGMLAVPVLFFRDVFGMASAYSFEGRIYIGSEESDMQ